MSFWSEGKNLRAGIKLIISPPFPGMLRSLRSLQHDNSQSDIITIVKEYYVYIMSNKSGTLYTGVTNDLEKRVYQHKSKTIDGFTKRYDITQLIYFESTNDVNAGIAREKEIKGMLRSKKLDLIRTVNPELKDLSEDWSYKNSASPP